MYQIRPVREADLPRIEEIYAHARAFMAQTGNPNQWGRTNPPRAQLEADICAGELYVVTEGESIHGVFAFLLRNDPTYGYIEGSWHSGEPYAAIHRVASDGSGGIFTAILTYCRSRCRHLRIDTHHDNKVMQHVVEKHGFRKCGIIYLANGDPRIAYDLI